LEDSNWILAGLC